MAMNKGSTLKLISKSDQLIPRLSDEDMEIKRFKRFMTWLEEKGELFPGLPDDVSWFHIIPNFSWKDLHTLSSVSPGWQQALKCREIHDHRVASCSTETLALHHHFHSDCPGESLRYALYSARDPRDHHFHINECHGESLLALYSARDKYCLELPPMPFSRESPHFGTFVYQHVSLDRKLFVFRAAVYGLNHYTQLYMIDLVEKHWKECANMNELRYGHQSVAWNGKIHIFGGCGLSNLGHPTDDQVSSCEVYDPEIDAWWTLIKPIPLCRCFPQVAIMGDEFVVYGGLSRAGGIISVPFLDIYHPLEDEWRRVVPRKVQKWDKMFMARGKFHRIAIGQIDVYDMEEDVWSLLHTFGDGPDGFMHKFLSNSTGRVAQIDDEVFISFRINWDNSSIFQSRGFGSTRKEISWEMVNCCHRVPLGKVDLVPIQL